MSLLRNSKGQTARQAAAQLSSGFESGATTAERRHPRLALRRRGAEPAGHELEVIGTGQGREIIALKLTQGASGTPDGTRPAVLYSSTQHAREWISTEVNRRLLAYLIAQWRANDKAIKNLLQNNELWFVLVANPDGYQYVPEPRHEALAEEPARQQRERDDGGRRRRRPEPQLRNTSATTRRGSSSIQSSDTYRGTDERSEPETQTIVGLYNRVDFAFHVNWHSAGQWLLYPRGMADRSADRRRPHLLRPLGESRQPGHRGLPSGCLVGRPLRDERRDDRLRPRPAWHAGVDAGALRGLRRVRVRLPGRPGPRAGGVRADERSRSTSRSRHRIPMTRSRTWVSDEALLPQERRHVQDRSAARLHVRRLSYGDPQEVRVLAKRALGDVTLKYSVNGGPLRARRPRNGTAASGTAARPTSTTTS